jgi:uncharacterized membrane protein YcaP (DUF421 family)
MDGFAEWFGAAWGTFGFVALSTAAMYASVLLGIRVAGRRTLSQLSAFDAVVTIALGSLLASTAVSSDPSYAQGVTALVTLLSLQLAVGALRRRFRVVRRVLDFPPVTVIREGEEQHWRQGVFGPQMTTDELHSMLRSHGIFDPSEAQTAVLEPNGELSVRRRARGDDGAPGAP